jgi:hypothetical protein
MSQFQPLRPTKKSAPEAPRSSVLFKAPATHAHAHARVTRALPMEPETTPLATVAQKKPLIRNPSTQGLQWQPHAQHTPLPATFKAPAPLLLPKKLQSNKRYLPVPVSNVSAPVVRNVNTPVVRNMNVPVVRNVDTQAVRNVGGGGWPNNRYVSISFPRRMVSTTIVQGSAIVVQKMPLVIPGTRKRLRDTDEINVDGVHLHPHLRHILVLLAAIGVFLLIMLSLTPLEQENGSLLIGFVQTKGVSQNNLSVLARDGGSDANASSGGTDYGYTTDQYIAMARADAVKYGINPDYYENQIRQESHFDPNAVSWVGAIGIAQFMPDTASAMHFDPHDPVAALDNGAQLMGTLNSTFGGDYAKALAAYNTGPNNVNIAVDSCGASWLYCLDPQTQSYVYIIMG